jgi:hypothetical protein
MEELVSLNDDSGYGSPSPKRQRLEAALENVRPPLISELEAGFSQVYLSQDGSLIRSFKERITPPVMNDPVRIARALNLSPNLTGGLRDQIERMIDFRNRPVQEPVPVIDLTQE